MKPFRPRVLEIVGKDNPFSFRAWFEVSPDRFVLGNS